MDAPSQQQTDFTLNFDFLSDEFEFTEATNFSGDSEKLPDDISKLLDTLTQAEQAKKSSDFEAFEEQSNKQHFSEVTADELDKIASENNAIATHWQTNWAVRVLRGNYLQLSVKFLL